MGGLNPVYERAAMKEKGTCNTCITSPWSFKNTIYRNNIISLYSPKQVKKGLKYIILNRGLNFLQKCPRKMS